MNKSYSNPYTSPYLRSYPRPHWSPYPTFSDVVQASLKPDCNVVLRNLLNMEFLSKLQEDKIKTQNRKYEWIKISQTLELPTDITRLLVQYIK